MVRTEAEERSSRNKDNAHQSALFWIELANNRLTNICNHFISLAAILIPLSASLVISNNILNFNEKIMLVSTWITLFFSIVFGFLHQLLDVQFFVYLSRDSSKREELWSNTNRGYAQVLKDVLALGTTKNASSHLPLVLQGITFMIGIILISFIGISLLFKQVPTSSNLDHKFKHNIYRSLKQSRF